MTDHPHDDRAERLLGIGWDIAVRLRDDDPADIQRTLSHLTHDDLRDLAIVLAACVRVDQPRSSLLGWWENHHETPASMKPLQPCGSYGAARRHRESGQALDPLCSAAARGYSLGYKAGRRRLELVQEAAS